MPAAWGPQPRDPPSRTAEAPLRPCQALTYTCLLLTLWLRAGGQQAGDKQEAGRAQAGLPAAAALPCFTVNTLQGAQLLPLLSSSSAYAHVAAQPLAALLPCSVLYSFQLCLHPGLYDSSELENMEIRDFLDFPCSLDASRGSKPGVLMPLSHFSG